ncbi:hypothetical protein [Sandarakinorhabdus glacialis]|uniref:hypothetical protein n=1 Tax=Sandarakinorhabdus glacialis TaxID=1614636 RepID=UPI0016673757|nr:hypothetical protein [Polymorphobacter glacialis]
MLSLLIAATIAAAPSPLLPARCDPRQHVHPADARAAVEPHRLDRQPAASTYLTVFRTVDSCLAPVIVNAPGNPAARQR